MNEMKDAKPWVQHISGTGRKYKVHQAFTHQWEVVEEGGLEFGRDFQYLHLPKDEYKIVPAPQQWVDVTAECSIVDCGIVHTSKITGHAISIHAAQWHGEGVYRMTLNKFSNLTAITIEKLFDVI